MKYVAPTIRGLSMKTMEKDKEEKRDALNYGNYTVTEKFIDDSIF